MYFVFTIELNLLLASFGLWAVGIVLAHYWNSWPSPPQHPSSTAGVSWVQFEGRRAFPLPFSLLTVYLFYVTVCLSAVCLFVCSTVLSSTVYDCLFVCRPSVCLFNGPLLYNIWLSFCLSSVCVSIKLSCPLQYKTVSWSAVCLTVLSFTILDDLIVCLTVLSFTIYNCLFVCRLYVCLSNWPVRYRT